MKKKILMIGIIALLSVGIVCFAALIKGKDANNSDTNIENAGEQNNTEQNIQEEEVSQEKSTKDIYMEVLENKREYVNESNKSLKIKEFVKGLKNEEAKVTYAFVDMDNDKDEELVALFDGDPYMIFNYEDGTVYGFEVVLRGLLGLKTDGYYYATGGADLSVICTSTFSKNVRNEKELALQDGSTYEVLGKKVTKSEYEKFKKEQYSEKEDVKWTEFGTITTTQESKDNTETDTSNTTTQTNTSTFKGGTYVYTYPNDGTEMGGTKEKLTFKDGNVTFNMEYFGIKKTGTYKIENNTVVVTYTKEQSFNQALDREETQNISETKKYSLKSNSIEITEQGYNKKYK